MLDRTKDTSVCVKGLTMLHERALPPGYPMGWEADVVLNAGSVAHLRPITPADADGIRMFHAEQSPDSIYMRFFVPMKTPPDSLIERTTVIDYKNIVVLVMTVRDKPIGYARMDRLDDATAEVACQVADSHHREGVSAILIDHLAAIGLELGVKRFAADVLSENRTMRAVLETAGYVVTSGLQYGVLSASFDIKPTAQSRAVQQAREHRAESRSVRGILTPRSVAVIGASRRPRSVGHSFLRNLVRSGFPGPVHAVNPAATEVLGLPCHPSLAEVPGPVDMAVIAVPARHVLGVVEECAAKGVRTLVVPSGHFAESGPEGLRLQQQLRAHALQAGMRLVGPVSFGIISTNPAAPLNASLAPVLPPQGRLGLFAESGPLALGVLASAQRRNLGLSVFASAGNRADVSGNDLMQYWIDDPATDVVGLYLEAIGNPRKFSRIARNLSTIKPVIVVKSGTSSYGVPPGHIVRPTNVGPEVFSALLAQAGVIRAEHMHQMFDIAQLVVHQPPPRGDQVAVVVNSHALAALTADAALSWGLRITHGPVALEVDASAAEYGDALRAALADPDVDSVLTSFIPATYAADEEVATVVRDAVADADKPCAATFVGMRGVHEQLAVEQPHRAPRRIVPSYSLPEDAARALAAATRYGQWRVREHGEPVAPQGIDHEAADQIIRGVLADSPTGRRLTPEETRRLLVTYGIQVWPWDTVRSGDEAAEAAERTGFPSVLQVRRALDHEQAGPNALRADLPDADAVRQAFASLTNRIGALPDERFIVQAMSPPGAMCIISTTEDPLFGPVVAFSATAADPQVPGDVGYRIPPLTDVDVDDLVRSARIGRSLWDPNGKEATPLNRLRDLIGRLSVLADEHPELASVILNPVNCWGRGVDVLGATITVAPAGERPDLPRRALN
jgi:acyl-CoA synthetase (NDP forming)/RimJ/RimL family protein N-acetyltransferase